MAPIISSLSGSAVTGSNITISGANFDTKPRSKPFMWADFQEGSIAPHTTLSNATAFNQVQNKSIAVDASNKRWGTYAVEAAWPRNATSSGRSSLVECDVDTMVYGKKLYITAWRKWVSADTSGNWKWWRIWPSAGAGNYPNSYLGDNDIVDTGNRLWYTENGSAVTGVNRKYLSYPLPNATWQMDEIRLQLSSAAGVADGNLEIRVNNTQYTTDSDFTFDYAGVPGIIRKVDLQDTKANSDPNASMRAFIDSFYIDDSWNRVYIGDNATFASCTHLEIQPFTAWSASSITINTRLGSYSSASGLFLFVVDNSNVASSGKALSSISGAAAPSVLSLSPSSGPASGGTTVTATCASLVSLPAVTVGGGNATAEAFISSSSMTFVTPSGTAGARDVVVTNPDTQTGTLIGGFTYVAAPTISSVTPSSGLEDGGTNITITGTGFQDTPTITIGGNSATAILFVSSVSLTCTVPAHVAGAVNVVVTNPDGQAVTSTNGYTYTASPQAPDVQACSPSSGPVAGGTNVTITGVGFSATISSVSFGGVDATEVVRLNSTTLTCTSPAGVSPGAVNIIVTNSDLLAGTLIGGFTYTAVQTSSGRRRTLAAARSTFRA